jgi:hypothetical protein
MGLNLLDKRAEIEITIIRDLFGFAEHCPSAKEVQEGVKEYFGNNYEYAKSAY